MFSFRPALAYDPIGRAAEVVSPYLPSLVGQLGMLGNQEMLHRIDLLGVGTPSETTPFDRLDQGRAAPMDAVTPSSSPVVVADGGMVVQKSFGGREIAAKVANGEVTVRGGVGGKNGRGGLAVSTDGVVTADGRVGGEAAGVEASLMVDVDANGIGSWSARGGVAAGPGSVHVGGGEVGGREVQALPNGKFKATVYAAKGASIGAKLGANDVENEGQASVGGASMVEAEFDTAAEAEAFAATQDPVRATWAANELQHLGPGERMRRELSVDVSQKASVSDGLKAAVGIEAGGQSSLELERRDDGRLRVTRANEASVGGSCGMGVLGLLGLDEELGVGFQNSESVDFDLEQAGALAAFETYQLTGELPDPLPAGVTLAGSRCTTSWRDQLKTTLPSGTHEVERVLEEGTEVDENGRGAGIMNATVRDAQTWGGPLTGELDRADATTVARLRTPDDECGGETPDGQHDLLGARRGSPGGRSGDPRAHGLRGSYGAWRWAGHLHRRHGSADRRDRRPGLADGGGSRRRVRVHPGRARRERLGPARPLDEAVDRR